MVNAFGLCCRLFCAKEGKVNSNQLPPCADCFSEDALLESKLSSSCLEKKSTEQPSSLFTCWSWMGSRRQHIIHQMDEWRTSPSNSPVLVQDHASYPPVRTSQMALNAPICAGFETAAIVPRKRRCLIRNVNVLMMNRMRQNTAK